MPKPYKMSSPQAEAIVELMVEQPRDQYRFTVLGPRESDRAILIRMEWGQQRAEMSQWFLCGFGGLVTAVGLSADIPNSKEFYPHG